MLTLVIFLLRPLSLFSFLRLLSSITRVIIVIITFSLSRPHSFGCRKFFSAQPFFFFRFFSLLFFFSCLPPRRTCAEVSVEIGQDPRGQLGSSSLDHRLSSVRARSRRVQILPCRTPRVRFTVANVGPDQLGKKYGNITT